MIADIPVPGVGAHDHGYDSPLFRDLVGRSIKQDLGVGVGRQDVELSNFDVSRAYPGGRRLPKHGPLESFSQRGKRVAVSARRQNRRDRCRAGSVEEEYYGIIGFTNVSKVAGWVYPVKTAHPPRLGLTAMFACILRA